MKDLESAELKDLEQALHYEEFRKHRPDSTRIFRRNAEYLLYLLGTWLADRFELKHLQLAGRFIGKLAYRFFPKERGIALMQLGKIHPELSPAQRESWCRECFSHFGQLLTEFLGMQKIEEHWPQCLDIENEEILQEALAQQKGVLLMALHQGNWELISLYAKHAGIKMNATTANFPEARVNEKLLQRRENQWMSIIRRGEPGTVSKLLGSLRNHEVLILAIDQDTNVPSNWVPFFGIPAKTPLGLAKLALKSGAPVLSYAILRQPEGRFKLIFEKIDHHPEAVSSEDQLFRLNRILNRHLEKMIEREPKQWAWIHRRWRHQPDEQERQDMEKREKAMMESEHNIQIA
ncbi:MAG: lysophospholipid acyltransferase family protein [SAR324 cluster bacterium]|nr:lysophospholipid acyltransferase family protein [SAR324 cluster bacterium]